jgi:hypothetical protein
MAKPKKGLPAAKLRQQQQSAKPNPFELKTSKSKFDVVGKRNKGSVKNVVKARQEAVNKVSSADILTAADRVALCASDRFMSPTIISRYLNMSSLPLQRKQTLLVEYKQLRNSNTFIDRRFGGEYAK